MVDMGVVDAQPQFCEMIRSVASIYSEFVKGTSQGWDGEGTNADVKECYISMECFAYGKCGVWPVPQADGLHMNGYVTDANCCYTDEQYRESKVKSHYGISWQTAVINVATVQTAVYWVTQDLATRGPTGSRQVQAHVEHTAVITYIFVNAKNCYQTSNGITNHATNSHKMHREAQCRSQHDTRWPPSGFERFFLWDGLMLQWQLLGARDRCQTQLRL
jgi:hypothetical protein